KTQCSCGVQRGMGIAVKISRKDTEVGDMRYGSSLAAISAVCLLGACTMNGQGGGDAQGVSNALELENGGLTTEDEAPAFGEESAFESQQLVDPSEAVDDPTGADPEVQAMEATPGATVYGVGILWGQIPGNPRHLATRNWNGAFALNRGAIIVR